MPKSIIGYAIRRYYRFKLSLRDVSEMLLVRGIEVSYEAIRNWCSIWGPVFAKTIRRKRGYSFKDKWHIDEEIKNEDSIRAKEERPKDFLINHKNS